jgi:hypothetical protein
MAESGRIAARGLRGTFWRIVAGAGFSQSLHHRYHYVATPHTREPRPCTGDFAFPPRIVAGLDATEDAAIDIVND